MIHFSPSPWLFSRTVFGGCLLLGCAAYLWQGYHDGFWWPAVYVVSLIAAVALFSVLVWLAVVPVGIGISQSTFSVRFHLRAAQEIGWDELECWGYAGEGTFRLQFEGRPTFQVALFAFPQPQRGQLIDFLARHFPQRKARLWFGSRSFLP